jgi:DNA-binding NtrC family response regulator
MADEAMIWIIDSQQWPRACLRAELMARGLDAIGFVKPAQALAALRHGLYARPRMIVMDLFELTAAKDEIAAVSRLHIPTVVLGGALQLNEQVVRDSEWAAVLRRPLKIGAIVDMVEKLLKDMAEPFNSCQPTA